MEDFLDELMMNMFSLIADQVRNKQELFDEEGKIMQALLNSGYHLHEADAALTLMQALVQKETETFFKPERAIQPFRVRTMTREERGRFSADAFSFALKLTLLGIISEDHEGTDRFHPVHRPPGTRASRLLWPAADKKYRLELEDLLYYIQWQRKLQRTQRGENHELQIPRHKNSN
jgi:hypothetical protein